MSTITKVVGPWLDPSRVTQSYIQEVKNKNGVRISLPDEMSTVFRDYYASLYGIQNNWEQHALDTFKQKLSDYLDAAALPHLPEQTIADLETPISSEELDQVLKDTPSGKAPGPDGYSLTYYQAFK